MSVSGELKGARAMIAQGWTQGAWAKAKDPLSMHSRTEPNTVRAKACPESFCYCATGPLVVFGASDESYLALEAALPPNEAESYSGPMRDVQKWNDARGRTQAEVLALYDRAIATAEALEPNSGPPDVPELTVVQ